MSEPMRIVRVFPRRTSFTPSDELSFVGDPPLFLPGADEVHVSVTFTWDVERAIHLREAWAQYYPVVKIGGPALGSPTGPYVPGMYVKRGVTFTTRGCNRGCPWCLVPQREGRLALCQDFAEGYIIQDNNFLQAPKQHRERVYAMLRGQKRAAVFSGGLEAALVTAEVAEELRSLRIRSLFLAADTGPALRPLARALRLLAFLGRDKLFCYVLIAYGRETIPEAERRLRTVWELGAIPFAQLWQPPDRFIQYSDPWRRLARTWSRPAAIKSVMGAK